MAGVKIFVQALLLVLISDSTLSDMRLSDYKICGDPECERPISRVQANKFHVGPDCRFLNFKRGDMIHVYYKLSGKRDNLWAGAINTDFGYFPKEAVDIEEIYTQEEIIIPAQEQDFFCIDMDGSITESDPREVDSQANQNVGVSGSVEHHQTSKSSEEPPSATEKHEFTENGDYSKTLAQDNLDNTKQESAERSGSYWIGSQISGWLGYGDQSEDNSLEQTREQASFRSRKLSLDVGGNNLANEPTSEASGWLGGRLTTLFGLGQRNAEVVDEEMKERDKSSCQSADQFSTQTQKTGGSKLSDQDDPVNSRNSEAIGEKDHPGTSVDERSDKGYEDIASVHSILSQPGVEQNERAVEASKRQEDKETQLLGSHIDAFNEMTVDQSMSTSEEKINQDNPNRNEESSGWYTSIYNSVSKFYSKKTENENGGDIQCGSSDGAASCVPGSDEKEKGKYGELKKEMISVFSADGISSMFSKLTLGYQPDTPDVDQDVPNKDSAAELVNEDEETSLEAKISNIYKSMEGSREKHVDENTISEHHSAIQLGIDMTKNTAKTEPMLDHKCKEITLDNKTPDEQHSLGDYSGQPDHSDSEPGTLKSNIEINQENQEMNKLESKVWVTSPDISGQLLDNVDQINSLKTGIEEIQSLEKLNTDGKNIENMFPISKEKLSEQGHLDTSDISQNMTDTLENFSDHSGGAISIESIRTLDETASTQRLNEEEIPAMRITETYNKHNSGEGNRLDSEMEPEEFNTHQSKDTGSDDTQSSTADHIRHNNLVPAIGQTHKLSPTEASGHNQAVNPSLKRVDVKVPDVDETPKSADTEEYKVEKNLNMIYKKEDADISTEEPFKIQRGSKNIDFIKGDIVVLTDNRDHIPSADIVGCKASSANEKAKNTFTSSGCNVENDSEMDASDCLELRRPNDPQILSNRESQDTKLDSAPGFSPDIEKTNEYSVSEAGKHRNKIPNNEKPGATDDTVISSCPGVHPVQDLEKVQQDTGTITAGTSRPKYFLDFFWSNRDFNDLRGTTADSVFKPDAEQGERNLEEMQSIEDIQDVDGNSKRPASKNVQGDDDHQSWPCSKSQMESCINLVDGEMGYETPTEQLKTEESGGMIHTGGIKGSSQMTRQSQNSEQGSFLSESQDEKSPGFQLFITESENFTDDAAGETVSQADNSVLNYLDSETQAKRLAHQVSEGNNCQTNFNQLTEEVNCKTSSENGEILPEISDHQAQEPSDKNQSDARRVVFISEKGAEVGTMSHRKSFENDFAITQESIAHHVKDSHQVQSESMTKQLGGLLKKDVDIEEAPQMKQHGDNIHFSLHAERHSQSIHATHDAIKASQVHKEFKNVQLHLNAEDVQYFLDIFGRHKLLWLDYCLGDIDIEYEVQKDSDLAVLSEFEQILEYQSEIISTTKKGAKVDRYMKEDGIHDKSTSLKKLDVLLSTLRSRYTLAKQAVRMNVIQEKTDCTTTNCVSAEKNGNTRRGTGEMPGVKDDSEEINSGTRNTVFLETNFQSSQKSNGVTEIIGSLFNFTGQLTITSVEKVALIYSLLKWLITEVVSSLPDDLKPGPDLHGLPWEAVIVTSLLGLITALVFFCRFYHSIASRLYVGKERKLGQKVAELLDEKCKVLQTLSECKHKHEELETALRNGRASSNAMERDNLEVMSRNLEQSNAQVKSDIDQLKLDLKAERTQRSQQEALFAGLQETLKSLEEEAKDLKSQTEQAQTTLKIYDINSERLQANLLAAKEENVLLQESEAQLAQEAEGWGERLGELEEEMKMCECSHKNMLEDCANKDERIESLTDCLLKMRDWDSEVEDEASGEELAGSTENGDNHQKQKLQKLICAAKMSADLKSMEEERNRVFARLNDEVKAKEDLQEGIEKLQSEKDSLQAQSAVYTSETQKLQQKLQIMTEMYQENELKLHRMLTVEERERLQKEEKLTKADKMISLAAEELDTYRQRSKELEEELDKTNLAYKNQIGSHEKKAHENWLAARAADRDLTHIKRENANLRQKLTDSQFKLEMLEKDPFALECSGRPLFRGERSPFGPSPLGRPSSENRAFLSPPTLMDGPLRVSPPFLPGLGGRASRGPVVSEGVDTERSGGPHSDSGSLSPTWERDRRGPPPPPGYPYPDPGLPYRRPPPAMFPMGPVPPRGPSPPDPQNFSAHLSDKSADSSCLGQTSDSLGTGENETRDSMLPLPGDLRAPPDPDVRMGPIFVPPMMRPPPPLDPRDFPRRGSYGPPEFYPPRVLGGPPISMRRPPPPGMFPRFPPPHPQHMGYPPARPAPEILPGPPPRPSPPGSEQPPEHPPEPQDLI